MLETRTTSKTPVNRTSTIAVALAALLGLYLSGCSSAPPVEPESDFIEMRPLIYDYGTVFDCVTEAISEEGLPVKEADRVKGSIVTDCVPGPEDHIKGTQAGSRVRADVVTKGPKDFVVRMAATRLVRDVGRDNQAGEWRYSG